MQRHISAADWDLASGKSVVVMAATTPSDPYYGEHFGDVASFQVDFAKKILHHENALILADPTVAGFYRDRLPPTAVAEFPLDDIWLRDYSPVGLERQVWFKYQPGYLKKSEAARVQGQLRKFCQQNGHLFSGCGGDHESTSAASAAAPLLRLDGGNVVFNEGGDLAVVTDRVLRDNRQLPRERLLSELRRCLACRVVALVPEAGDRTGHSDGMVAFLDSRRLAVSGHAATAEVLAALRSLQLTGAEQVQIVRLDSSPTDQTWRGFESACGLHVNLLATRLCLYVPVFGSDPANQKLGQSVDLDERILAVIRANTTKTVVPVDVPNVVCRMGGSVRCLTWAFARPAVVG